MIKSVTFAKRPTKNENRDTLGYELSLKSLAGKHFEFKPGVNILVGDNGCGKTSFINVLRKMTLCNRVLGSSNFFNQYWQLSLSEYVDMGYFDRVDLQADFSISFANVREVSDLESNGEYNTLLDFVQYLDGHNKSAGQNKLNNIQLTMDYLSTNSSLKWSKNDYSHLDFNKSCLQKIKEIAKDNKKLKLITDYYDSHHLGNQEGYNKEYYGYTIFADEPDASVDIHNLEQLYAFYASTPNHYQHIVSMHNVALIYALSKLENVNVIDLSKGYYKEIVKFMENKKLV